MLDNMELIEDHDFIYYSFIYTVITVIFAMAVFSKFLSKDSTFGFRSFLSLITLFVGEPVCQLLLKGSSGVLVFGVACCFVYYVLPSSHLPTTDKVVLITGCDSGFGSALAKKLDSMDIKVFAGCLYSDGPGAIELQNACSHKLHVLQLDVTSEQQIRSAYEVITENVKETGLWAVVNNAGCAYLADIEMTSEKIIRRTMEVNLFGTVRVTKTFLPLVKKSRGRFVNMSSMVGKVMFPGFSAYGISKHAIEGFSDCLRLEMKKWGVSVSVVEPVGFKTGWATVDNVNRQREEVWCGASEDAKQEYGREYLDRQYDRFIRSSEMYSSDLSVVVRALQSALLSKQPMERYPVGRGAGTIVALSSLLPVRLMDKVVALTSFSRDILPAALRC